MEDDDIEIIDLGEESPSYTVAQNKMGETIRDIVLETSRNFKTSWVELGQALYSVWKDKLFYEWGFEDFEVYVTKEAGLNKKTAVKLLRNYFFLEKEAPKYVQKKELETAPSAKVPSQDAVNVLRMAKARKDLEKEDYNQIKKHVLEDFKDAQAVKKDISDIIKKRKETTPDEARRQERLRVIKRFMSTLGSLRNEAQILKLFPQDISDSMEDLMQKLTTQLIKEEKGANNVNDADGKNT